jgi:hypothetical protein
MTCPNTQDFSAWINLQPPGPPQLIVKGEVETDAGHFLPVLAERVPQGFNPTILMLDLTIKDTGQGGTDDVSFRPCRFDKPAERGQYISAEIYFEGTLCVTLDVAEVH